MAFQPNNQFMNNNQQAQGGPKKRTNFPIRTIWGPDAKLDITLWMSDYGPKMVLSIKQFVGKDLDKGTNIAEQKMPNELPNILLNPRYIRGIHQFIENADPANITGKLEWTNPKTGQTDKSLIFGNENGKATMTLDVTSKGQRKVTFDTVSFGGSPLHSDWEEFKAAVKVCLDKITTIKMDSYDELNPGNSGDSE